MTVIKNQVAAAKGACASGNMALAGRDLASVRGSELCPGMNNDTGMIIFFGTRCLRDFWGWSIG